MFRRVLSTISYVIILGLKPLKLFAYHTRFHFLKRLILAFTTAID